MVRQLYPAKPRNSSLEWPPSWVDLTGMDWDTEYAEDHLLTLARRNEITIVWDDRPQHAYTSYRTAHVSRPTDPVQYLIALHEFGHIASPQARRFEKRDEASRAYDDYALCEAAAWAWAARFCDDELFELVNGLSWKRVGALFATSLPWTHQVKIGRRGRDCNACWTDDARNST